MILTDPLTLAALYLLAMVVAAPIARRLGLGTVLGYLLAGMALGPSLLGILGKQANDILHFAEFGVTMMLFLIGLELRPTLLWKMKGPIFGLGGAQVLGTTAVIFLLSLTFGNTWKVSLAAGMILCLSSTAIVLQTLQEKGALKTTGGETAFSVLLFQDIAVIPMLAIFPFLASHENFLEISQLGSEVPAWIQAAKVLGAVVSVILIGRYLIHPIFHLISNSRLRELFTAMALLLILGTNLLMTAVGLSPALGAFLAGVVLAESEFRHQLETDIEPFKGLLLGVFFISVGAGIDFSVVAQYPSWVVAALLTLLLVKWLVLIALGKVGRLSRPDRLMFAFSLAQGGEFAFVLLNIAEKRAVFPMAFAQALTAAVALSMFFAPILIQLYFKIIQPRFATHTPERPPDEIAPTERGNPVIIAGFGRFGQMVTRLLRSAGFRTTVLDYDADQIDVIRRIGMKGFYGDASHMDLLRSAGAEQAKLLILAIDDREKTLEIIDAVKSQFPNLLILARAYDRIHAYEMIHRGISYPYIETSGSALNLGTDALRVLGVPAKQAVRIAQIFKRHNDESIQALAKVYHEADESTFVFHARNWITALEGTLKADTSQVHLEAESAWESAPRSPEQNIENHEG
jgi:monovalent cation:proton antiporter-2 (CPA2) family protein